MYIVVCLLKLISSKKIEKYRKIINTFNYKKLIMDSYTMLYFIVVAIFLLVTILWKYIDRRLHNSEKQILKLEKYLPSEEIHSLRQIYYLVMMTLFVINIFYQILAQGTDLIYFSILDIILSLIAIGQIKIDDLKSTILAFAMIPFVSLDYLLFYEVDSLDTIMFVVHLIGLIFVAHYFYLKFKKHAKSQGLSYTILLLYGIIFFSFIFTSLVENVDLLNSLVMVSNAFTSNGYSILGHTILGKLNGIFLVWAGYILSGVGTATLTVALVVKYYNKRFDELEELIKELKDEK